MSFTRKQKKEYYKTKNSVCLYCGNKNVTALMSLDLGDGRTAEQEIGCDDCGRMWKDVYKLIDVLEENEMR